MRGLVYGIVIADQLVHDGSVGALGAGLAAPDRNSLFRIASMTKSFTAAAFLHARDAQLLALHDPVARYVAAVKEWVLPTADSPPITLIQLLSMSSGLATDDPWADRHLDIGDVELNAIIADGPLFACVPGETFQYSNLGFGILGQAFVTATGIRLQDYVSDHLLAPLGMQATVWELDDSDPRLCAAHGYHTVDGAWLDEAPPLGDGGIAPMGGLWSTVSDLSKWISFWCDAWPARDGADRLALSRASRREAQRVHTDLPLTIRALPGRHRLSPSGYGLGLRVTSDLRLGRVVDHSGGVPGFGSNMRWAADHSVGVIALANERYADMAALTADMLDALTDPILANVQPRQCPPALRATCLRLVELLNHWDDRVAETLFGDNVALDEPLARRRVAAQALVRDLGPFHLGNVIAHSNSAATAVLSGERTQATLQLLMSPLNSPQVQRYSVAIQPPSPPDSQ